MPPKLNRENASLRQAPLDPVTPVQEAGTNQKIPQKRSDFVSAKVWWDVQEKGSQHDVKEKAG